MSRLSPKRQQGFGLLVFVLIATTIALSLVLGYSGLLTRQEAQQRTAKLQAYLSDARSQILSFYGRNLAQIDSVSLGNNTSVNDLLAGGNVNVRYGLQAALSKPLASDSGLYYRRVVLYMPSETDGDNPPNIAAFVNSGDFQSCTDMSKLCGTRTYVVFDSLTLEKAALAETKHRLEEVAYKAQAYFKARMLLDPEHNVSVDYFRPAYGGCSPGLNDLQCLDTYTPLAVLSAGSWATQTNLPATIGLTNDELISAWGDPIQASNLADSQTGSPPFTMMFRAPSPFGGFYSVTAVQQI